VPWHQDATYFGLAPFEHITAWVALTPSRPESGCVRVIPGSHKSQLAHFDDHNDALTMLSLGRKLATEPAKRSGGPCPRATAHDPRGRGCRNTRSTHPGPPRTKNSRR